MSTSQSRPKLGCFSSEPGWPPSPWRTEFQLCASGWMARVCYTGTVTRRFVLSAPYELSYWRFLQREESHLFPYTKNTEFSCRTLLVKRFRWRWFSGVSLIPESVGKETLISPGPKKKRLLTPKNWSTEPSEQLEVFTLVSLYRIKSSETASSTP